MIAFYEKTRTQGNVRQCAASANNTVNKNDPFYKYKYGFKKSKDCNFLMNVKNR